MKALLLEKKGKLAIRDIDIQETVGPKDVRIAVKNVGICGSDVHYYTHGRIGPFEVKEPMVLGHEASGIVTEVGKAVTHLETGDRVCMEPGIPEMDSRAAMLGKYNLDPQVRFWATPPIHGVLRTEVVHPSQFTFRLPSNVSFKEGAMIEPLAIGVYSAGKANIAPGDVAAVIGAGTIGLMTAVSALAAGCSEVIIFDVKQPKLEIARSLGIPMAVNSLEQDPVDVVMEYTRGWGVDVVFEASGHPSVAGTAISLLKPGGKLVYIGMPVEPVSMDIVALQAKEISVETVFRYAHVYDRSIALIGSGKIDVKPLITDVYPFERSIEAFDYAVDPKPTSVKVQIEMP